MELSGLAKALLFDLKDVTAERPRPEFLERKLKRGQIHDQPFRDGIEALRWVTDERGLGGGRELDGLAWQLPLEQLWERFVESVVRREVAKEGGEVRVGRLGETLVPLQWSIRALRSLGHLVPDIVVRRGRCIRVIDAKYKAHLAELDETGWRTTSEELKESHRADLHQILAYASLYDAEEITATLVYPLRQSTWQGLAGKGQDVWRAELVTGGRLVRLELRGLPFGHAHAA